MAAQGCRHAEVYRLLLLLALLPGPALALPASTRQGGPAPTVPAEFREARGPWSTLYFYARKRKEVARAPTLQEVAKVTKEEKKDEANTTDRALSTVQQPRHWTMEEPTPSPATTTTTTAPPFTRDYSGLYISPPIMVLDGNGERDNTRVVHDVLVVKNRPSRRPSTLRPPGSSNLVQPSIIRRPPPFWAGTAVPSGYGVSHAVLMNNHRPPSASSSFKRPYPGVTSIHIYPLTTAPSTTTSVYPPQGTIASVPLSVYDTVANTTIVHQNIITLSKPTYSSSSSSSSSTYSPSQTTTSSPPYMEEEDFGTTTEAMTESTETSSQSSPSRPSTTEPMPDWALQHHHQHRPVVTTTAPSSSLVAPIGSMPGILGPIGNLMQKFPTGSLSMFQNIGRVMAVLPTMLAAFLLTALLFV
ncbi:hypothetical protein HPB50_005611 [Hyalomma asiaticum]|uniref:Uncharacterized protein n=1 Tax=Hyalomma asiaticum TaxID=266040 RepID=A0ACB7RY46_HYAAI|nr:hypothetical protein HPB50_005611 [Hyalomma asiaticum]